MNKHFTEQIVIFLSVSKWIIISTIVGIIIGATVTFFLQTLALAEDSRGGVPFHYYYLLPLTLPLSMLIVKTFAPTAEGHGTEKVIDAVHKKNGDIDASVIPVKLLATVITIFSGGSVGKEGPGAQIGAGTASIISKLFKFNNNDRKKLAICGISAGFATVFGTPIAGAIFGVEVLIIGVIFYDVLLPSFIAGFAAFTTAQFLGVDYTYFNVRLYQSVNLDLVLIFQVILAGLFFGIISDIMITGLSWTEKIIKSIRLNPYLKAFLGGLIIIILVSIFGERYLGLGLDTIKNALNPVYLSSDLPWYEFLMKIVFTSITLGSGGSGGIITPVFYVGATSGHLFGTIMDGHLSLFAALGFASVLAGVTNAPIAATIMSVELFGIEIAHYVAISSVISFLITGHRSIFPSQILAMKKAGSLNIKFGDNIENVKVGLDDQKMSRLIKMFQKKQKKDKDIKKF